MFENQTIECSICLKEIEQLNEFNGEPMCQECYHDEDNYVFGDDIDD